ncbi:hydroxymethylbilane synthase [Weeksellaceae bacterium A-14]
MKSIKIGTRKSPLAMWQAREVARNLQNHNFTTDISPIVSSGDKDLVNPLYAMGLTGVFTKDLDYALLDREIDIAVHSLKDVPTDLPDTIEILAYLKRDYPQDVLVRSKAAAGKDIRELKVATSSLRRRAFWRREFPETEFVDIRGNVSTRLQKIEDGLADATIFSLAGLKRLELNIAYEELPFMIPAPGQGVVVVTGHSANVEINRAVRKLNDAETQYCVENERAFLKTLEGGCTAPIGAFAEIVEGQMRFVARLCSKNGKECVDTDEIFNFDPQILYGNKIAITVLKNGGKEIMELLY